MGTDESERWVENEASEPLFSQAAGAPRCACGKGSDVRSHPVPAVDGLSRDWLGCPC
jgi:hypothetical protein